MSHRSFFLFSFFFFLSVEKTTRALLNISDALSRGTRSYLGRDIVPELRREMANLFSTFLRSLACQLFFSFGFYSAPFPLPLSFLPETRIGWLSRYARVRASFLSLYFPSLSPLFPFSLFLFPFSFSFSFFFVGEKLVLSRT